MKIQKVIDFARKHGYDNVKPLDPWREYEVYEPVFTGNDVVCIGLPLIILIKDETIRMSTGEEALQQIRES